MTVRFHYFYAVAIKTVFEVAILYQNDNDRF